MPVVLMPKVEARGAWEHLKKAGGRSSAALGPPYTFCASCTVGIGANYVARELYLLPVLRLRKRRPTVLTFQAICGICARDEYALHHGFCAISDEDWDSLDLDVLREQEAYYTTHLHRYLISHWPTDHFQDELRRLAPELETPRFMPLQHSA